MQTFENYYGFKYENKFIFKASFRAHINIVLIKVSWNIKHKKIQWYYAIWCYSFMQQKFKTNYTYATVWVSLGSRIWGKVDYLLFNMFREGGPFASLL